jgi:two-component system, OmpR family, KDP operon response regulator KdpE
MSETSETSVSSSSSSLHASDLNAMPAARPPGADPATRVLRILLVEDHADTAEIFLRILCIDGHRVRLAATLAEARSLCREILRESVAAGDPDSGLDVVLCDVGLPDGNGADLLPLLRALHHGAKVIATTSYCMPDDLARVKDAGFDAVLSKPFEFPHLMALLRD